MEPASAAIDRASGLSRVPGRTWRSTPQARSVRRRRMVAVVVVGAVAALLVLASPAAATWSIVATDPASGDVGAALASCVPVDILGSPDKALVPVVLVPGKAAAVTQGELDVDAPRRILDLVDVGASPEEVLTELRSPAFDHLPQTRQHAVVSLDGRAAAFTGSDLTGQALDRQAPGVSVQGNLLVSDQVVTSALDAYDRSRVGGSDLATALVQGLLAGAQLGGDRRCPGQAALFAQVVVAHPTDPADAPSTLVTVTVDPGDGQDPVVLLAQDLADGRTGLIPSGLGTTRRGGQAVQLTALVLGLLAAVAGVWVLRTGLGSVKARR